MRAIVVTALITITIALGIVYWLGQPLKNDTGFCVTQVGNTVVETDLEQTKWATQMAAIGINRELPPRATTIAIATAYQESKMRNINYGDRDSLGLFQQRPSQGWGSEEQIMNPIYAINAFYEGLERVNGYTDMEITRAAQAVQRSAFPEAYAQHEANARALASALRGYSPAAFACAISDEPSSLTALNDYLSEFWPESTISSDGEQHSITISGPAEDSSIRGWALAHFLVGNAAEFGIASVSYDDMRWESAHSQAKWIPTENIGQDSVAFTLN